LAIFYLYSIFVCCCESQEAIGKKLPMAGLERIKNLARDQPSFRSEKSAVRPAKNATIAFLLL